MADLLKYLPTTRKEMELRGWDEVDIVFFTGDAYIDHPSFGAAVLGRVLEAAGYRVAIVPQPDWHGDFRDFTKFGRPRICFAVSAGSMDSMVNHYTAAKRRRSDDAYTPEGKAGARPDYCTITYCKILKQLYPDVPIVIGGIEASMRRLTHYDYWQDKLLPSILVDSGADMLVYGMGEQAMKEIVDRGFIHDIPQTAFLTSDKSEIPEDAIMLASHEEALRDKRKHAENFRLMEIESNKIHQTTLVQPVGKQWVVVNPSYPPITTEQLDAIYDLPYQYAPHPKYKDKHIPAYEMIKWSVCMHRGCFGGCSFCTISAHQVSYPTGMVSYRIWAVPLPICTLCTARTCRSVRSVHAPVVCNPIFARISIRILSRCWISIARWINCRMSSMHSLARVSAMT